MFGIFSAPSGSSTVAIEPSGSFRDERVPRISDRRWRVRFSPSVAPKLEPVFPDFHDFSIPAKIP
jgi:hypothetical protein